MLGFYNYTVIATYMGLASAVVGIFFANSDKPAIAILCLLFSGLCDMYDGKIARTRKKSNEAEKKFGIQIDSLSDLVCFGVLPAMIGYSVGMRHVFYLVPLVWYVLAALIRLAYFNVMEEERQSKTVEHRKTYSGLPVTTVALFFPILYTFRPILNSAFPMVYAGGMLLIGFLFLLNFTVKKPGKVGMWVLLAIGIVELLVMMLSRFFV